MIDRLYKQFCEGINERRAAHLPGTVSTIVGVTGCTLVCILLAVILVPHGKPPEYHFASERGAITALSAISLAAASAFSAATVVVLNRTKESHVWVWLVLALDLAFLSIDELQQFHESVGRMLGHMRSSGPFRN